MLKPVQKEQLRGKVRDITPADLRNAANLDEPTFIRHRGGNEREAGTPYRGYKGLVIDNSDLETPDFLRRKRS